MTTASFSDPGGGPRARDFRLIAPVGDGIDVVRLRAVDGGQPTAEPLSFSTPRLPVTVAFDDVVPAAQPALVDWPVAFVFPCQRLSVQSRGITDVPQWRIAAPRPDTSGDIISLPSVGGPYAAAAHLVEEVEYPVYLDRRLLEHPITLLRWVPSSPTAAPEVTISRPDVAGWVR